MGFQGRWQELAETTGWYSLLLYTLLLPFRFFAPLRLTTPRGILLSAVALVLATRVAKREWRPSPLDLPLLALLATVVLSSLLSIDPAYSLHSLKREMLPFLVLFWGTWNLASTPRRRREMTLALAASCLLVVLTSTLFGHYDGSRFRGIFPYPTQVGKYMDLVIPLVGGVAVSPGYPPHHRIAAAALLIASVGMVVLSQTRTSILLLLLTLGTLAAALRKRAVWAILALAVAVVVAFTLSSSRIKKRMLPLLTSPLATVQKDRAMTQRYLIYRNTIKLIKTRPLIGWGYGRHISKRIIRKNPAIIPLAFWHSHNLFLEVTLQCGVVGLAAFLWVFLVLGKGVLATFRSSWRERDPEAMGYSLGLVAIGLHSMVSIPQWGTTLLVAVFSAMTLLQGRKAP